MKQIILIITLIVTITAAMLAYRLVVDDIPADLVGSEPAVNTGSGEVAVEVQQAPVPGMANKHRVVSTSSPDTDRDPANEDNGFTAADRRTEYVIDGAAKTATQLPDSVRPDVIAEDVASEGRSASTGGSAVADSPAGLQADRMPHPTRGNRAQSAVDSPGIQMPFLDKTYSDGRQYRPNAMQDYFSDEAVQPQNPVDEDKRAYYPESRERMKDVFKGGDK